VVKPGDIVKVKVLEVDIPRNRISLTLRLDDEVGSTSGGSRTAGNQSGRGPGNQGGRGQGGRGPGGQGGRGQGGGQGGRGAGGTGQAGQGGRAGQNRGGRDNTPSETPMDETSLADAFRKAGFTVR
jgi:uncharacterized protein